MPRVTRIPIAAEVGRDAPLKAAAFAIGGAIGGATGVLVKALIGANNVTYGDAWIIGGAAGVGVVLVYLLL